MNRPPSRWLLQVVLVALAAGGCTQATESATPTTRDVATAENPLCGDLFSLERTDLGIGRTSEVHGLVASRRHADVIWVLGEVRDELRLWAVGRDDGEPLGEAALPADLAGVIDMAIGPGTDGDDLYLLLDDPDLDASVLEVLRVTEPDPSAPQLDSEPTLLKFSSSGQRPPATALMIDGDSGDLYVVSTARRRSKLHRASAPISVEGTGELAAVAGIDESVTGADLSADGDALALRTLFDILIWERNPGEEVAATIASAPCVGLVADNDLGGPIGFDGDGHLTTIQPGLQPSMSQLSVPPLTQAADEALDETRAGSVAPKVTITNPPSGSTVIEGVPLEVSAQVDDDNEVRASNLQWRLEAKQCPGQGDCLVTDSTTQFGSSVMVTPTGAAREGSQFVLTVTYTDDFDLTTSDTLALPFQLPEPVLGSSVAFAGGHVDVGDIPGLSEDISIEFWVLPGDRTVLRNPIGKTFTGEAMVTQGTDGRLTFDHGDGGDNDFLRSSPLPSGVWSHAVVTRSGRRVRWYVNGSPDTGRTFTVVPSDSSLPLVIGDGYANEYDGRLDEVAVYGQALTASQVADHYATIGDPVAYGKLVMGDSPIGYWRLDEPAGTLARDETGQWDGIYDGVLSLAQAGAAVP